MKEFIAALMVLFPYLKDKEKPCFTCEHDVMIIQGVDFEYMPRKIMLELYNMGFFPGNPFDAEIEAQKHLHDTYGKSEKEALEIFTEDDRREIFSECQDSLYSTKFGSC